MKQYGAPKKEYAPLLNSMTGLMIVEFRKFADGQFQTMPYAGNPVPCDGWYQILQLPFPPFKVIRAAARVLWRSGREFSKLGHADLCFW
ncbi:hypothetical protein [Paraburkholderia tuberum]|uniref:hypothetical protein n=1 Tax=Paraburkholderia tuberum TaxID=157910 RepID=UPI000B82DF1A|nr:hypothetical protein [Paraburkholderia tuberum]